MKKVLVIGGGGREHAIVDAISRSPQVGKIYCAPGNAGIAAQAECVAIKDTDVEALKAFAIEKDIDLAVVGPEVALAAGVVDAFKEAGLRIFGPSKAAATIESSKDFAKQLMAKYDIPTAAFETFDDYEAALEYVKKGSFPVVLKYDGLAAGKGVVIPETLEEADIIIYNTCAIREHAEDRVFGNVGALKTLKKKNPNIVVAVCGCMSQAEGRVDSISRKFPFVDIIFGTHNLEQFKSLLLKKLN